MLIVEAREALGPAHDQDDADVLQELFLKLLEKGLWFPEIRGAGIIWLQRMVRLIAKDWVRRQGPPPGMAGWRRVTGGHRNASRGVQLGAILCRERA